ncbi:ABC transporter substrate-binding protein [Jiangella muralis]|uniref:ABC transporter substrate-binding protein n=1 Tax=Jiangella muralis TaxID=702383 RepID=UPI00069E09A9|nr:extracellular solute-binding protein [Jiangella muralis]
MIHSIAEARPDRRRFLRLLGGGAAVMAAGPVLAACGADETSGGGGEMTGELEVWDFLRAAWPEWKQVQTRADERFQGAHEGATVKRVEQPSDTATYNQLLQSAITSRSGPDVLLMQPYTAGVFSFQSGLADITDAVDPAIVEAVEPSLASAQADGKLYGLPTGLQANVIFYNKEIFAAAGLDPDAAITTYDQLVGAGQQLKSAGYTPIAGGNKEGEINGWMNSFLFPGLGTYEDSLKLASGEMEFTDDLMVEVVERYVAMVSQGLFTEGMQSMPLSDYEPQFRNGEAGMILSLATNGINLSGAVGNDNLGVIQAPGIASATPHYYPAGTALVWCVSRFSERADLAAEFVASLADADTSQDLYTTVGWLPANTTAETGDTDYPVLAEMADAYSTYEIHEAPGTQWRADLANAYKSQLQLVIAGSASAVEALAEVQRVADQSR